MGNQAYNIVKGVLNALKDAGLIKVKQVGHEGFWEIELLVSSVSEIEHVLGSRPAPSPSPSQTLPLPTPPHPPSYVASTSAHTHEERPGAEEVLVNKKTSLPYSQSTRSGSSTRNKGGGNLELFNPDQQYRSKDMEDFMSIWNGVMVLPRIVSMKGREKVLHELLKDPFFKENYREGIKKIAASKFCRGHNRQGTGQRPWKATVDWFLQSHVLPKVLEGIYDDDKSPEITPSDAKFTQETL